MLRTSRWVLRFFSVFYFRPTKLYLFILRQRQSRFTSTFVWRPFPDKWKTRPRKARQRKVFTFHFTPAAPSTNRFRVAKRWDAKERRNGGNANPDGTKGMNSIFLRKHSLSAHPFIHIHLSMKRVSPTPLTLSTVRLLLTLTHSSLIVRPDSGRSNIFIFLKSHHCARA